MIFETDILPPLVAITADAPVAADRSTGNQLLAREQCARLRDSTRDQERGLFANECFADLAKGVHAPGGIDAALRYGLGRNQSAGSVPRVPAGGYSAVLAEVTAEATSLINAVEAAMGSPWLAAERFTFNGYAHAGSAFKHAALLHPLDSPDIELDSAGVWRVQVHAKLRSYSPTPGVSVGFSLVVSGTGTVATYSQSRADVDDDGDELVGFDTSDDITVAGARTLTVVNSSANDELMVKGSLIRVWKL
jgi:hypothetical protein